MAGIASKGQCDLVSTMVPPGQLNQVKKIFGKHQERAEWYYGRARG